MDDYLRRVLEGRQTYERLLEKIEVLNEQATKVTVTLSDMPKGRSGSTLEDVWALLVDYKAELARELVYYYADSVEMEDQFDKYIPKANERIAMKFRYIDGLKIKDIADKLGYDLRYTQTLLAQGKAAYYAGLEADGIDHD